MGTDLTKNDASLPQPVASDQPGVVLSVCIVTFKARALLRDCLHSLAENAPPYPYEIITIDNGSKDGVGDMLQEEFPGVRYIENPENTGFSVPYNQALRASRGRYLLLLNPDTLILPQAVERLVAFLEAHPDAGVCGPKVLNSDLTLQKPCRRGEPRPLAVASYFLGLSTLFPRSKFFGGYLLNYLDEDEVHVVDGVSGSCMLIRRAVIDQIGYLDERYFAYQEDADYCHRARQAGWRVYYVPQAHIIHYGGRGGSRVEPYRSIVAWHRSYFLYYRKNLASDYFFLFNWLYYFAMLLKFLSALLINLFRREKYAGPQRTGPQPAGPRQVI
jgi:GT2 family glycosyltransferase